MYMHIYIYIYMYIYIYIYIFTIPIYTYRLQARLNAAHAEYMKLRRATSNGERVFLSKQAGPPRETLSGTLLSRVLLVSSRCGSSCVRWRAGLPGRRRRCRLR